MQSDIRNVLTTLLTINCIDYFKVWLQEGDIVADSKFNIKNQLKHRPAICSNRNKRAFQETVCRLYHSDSCKSNLYLHDIAAVNVVRAVREYKKKYTTSTQYSQRSFSQHRSISQFSFDQTWNMVTISPTVPDYTVQLCCVFEASRGLINTNQSELMNNMRINVHRV